MNHATGRATVRSRRFEAAVQSFIDDIDQQEGLAGRRAAAEKAIRTKESSLELFEAVRRLVAGEAHSQAANRRCGEPSLVTPLIGEYLLDGIERWSSEMPKLVADIADNGGHGKLLTALIDVDHGAKLRDAFGQFGLCGLDRPEYVQEALQAISNGGHDGDRERGLPQQAQELLHWYFPLPEAALAS